MKRKDEGKSKLVPFKPTDTDIRVQEIEEELNLKSAYPDKNISLFKEDDEKEKENGPEDTVIDFSKDVEERKKKEKRAREIVESVVIAMIVYALITFGFDKSVIMSPSMEPTLMTGDIVIYNCFTADRYNLFGHKNINRGDIVEFIKDNEILSKRVIGVAGDTISFSEDGKVVINDAIYLEDYISEDTLTLPGLKETYTVPEGMVFVLGDNRGDSYDSRFWEEPYVKLENIIGKYSFTLKHAK